MQIIKKGLFFIIFIPSVILANPFIPERTKTEADTELGWLVVPLPINVEGIGSTVPIAGIFSNFYKTTDLLFVAPFIKGDIEAKVFSVYKLPIVKESLFFTVLYNEYLIGFRNYD